MRAILHLAVFVFTFWHILATPALSARYGLVIGIDEYQNVPKLKKAVSDAKAVSQFLQSIGFRVTVLANPDRRSLNIALAKFLKSVQPGDEVYFHYSGHGVEIAGRNYLLPADVPASSNKDLVMSESFRMDDLVARVAASGARVRIFTIDACRDNPFEQVATRSFGNSRGLAPVQTIAGTFIFYSAGVGQTALDSLNSEDQAQTSVYTRNFLTELSKPHAHLGEVARRVRRSVANMAKTVDHDQNPAYYDELSDDYCLVCTSGVMLSRMVEEVVTIPIRLTTIPTKNEVDHSYWRMNRSLVALQIKGDVRRFVYRNPRRALSRSVSSGTVLFDGRKVGAHRYSGKARVFSGSCPVIKFAVSGPIEKRGKRIVLYGHQPVRNGRTCKVIRTRRVKMVFNRQ